jgi:peptidoglycan/LPS O-acetylase OafA/YrhL
MIENRLLGADFVRATACLIVLFHHLAQRMNGRTDFGWLDWFKVFSQIGTFGVAMFFVLSGFLLARPFWTALDADRPMPSLRTYALRRAARILPGFWLALTVTFVLSITVFEVDLTSELWMRFFAGFFLVADWHWITFFPVEVNGPLWSICFEIFSYVALPIAFLSLFLLRGAVGRGLQSRLLWLVAIAVTLGLHWIFANYYRIEAFGRGWQYGLIGGAKYWMPRFNPFAFFAMFAIGSLAAGLQVMIARHRSLLFDLMSVAGIALSVWLYVEQAGARGTEGYGFLGVPYAYPWFELTVGLVLFATPSSVLVGRILDNPATRYIAQISFGIYIYHYIVLELVRHYWAPTYGHGGSTDLVTYVGVSLVICGFTVLASHLSFRWMEKPIIDWARGKEHRPVPGPTLSPAAG